MDVNQVIRVYEIGAQTNRDLFDFRPRFSFLIQALAL